MTERLKQLKEDINKPTKKNPAKKKPTKKKPEGESVREARIPLGFSLRQSTQKRGQKPKCKGCGLLIDYADACIRHKHREKVHYKRDTIDQYLCTVECVSKMSNEHLRLFVKKKWVQPVVKSVALSLSNTP